MHFSKDQRWPKVCIPFWKSLLVLVLGHIQKFSFQTNGLPGSHNKLDSLGITKFFINDSPKRRSSLLGTQELKELFPNLFLTFQNPLQNRQNIYTILWFFCQFPLSMFPTRVQVPGLISVSDRPATKQRYRPPKLKSVYLETEAFPVLMYLYRLLKRSRLVTLHSFCAAYHISSLKNAVFESVSCNRPSEVVRLLNHPLIVFRDQSNESDDKQTWYRCTICY